MIQSKVFIVYVKKNKRQMFIQSLSYRPDWSEFITEEEDLFLFGSLVSEFEN